MRAVKCALLLSFGLTLKLLVINISSSPAINTAAYYQRCVTTNGTVAMVHWRPCWQHLPVAALTAGIEARYIYAESRFLPTSPAFNAPVRGGGFRRNIAMPCGMEKLEWCGCPMVKIFYDMFIRCDRIHECDGHTQTDTAWRHRPHLHSIVRQKWLWWSSSSNLSGCTKALCPPT